MRSGIAQSLQARPENDCRSVIDPKADTDEKIVLAAKVCPTKAISLEEEGTGRKIFPVD